MLGEPPKISIICIRIAYSRNKLWLRQYIGADMLFPPILLVLEKEKHCKNSQYFT